MGKKSAPKQKDKREVDLCLETHLREIFGHSPTIEAEYKFHGSRKWAFDYAIPQFKLAIEIEGGIWTFGRHSRGRGYQDDLQKYNSATAGGWTIFRFSTEDILKGDEIFFLADWMSYRVGQIRGAAREN